MRRGWGIPARPPVEAHARLAGASLEVDKWGPAGHKRLDLERTEVGWNVDGMRRADVDGAEEPDLSITPFCDTFPIRRITAKEGQSLIVETCYVDTAAMTAARSRQRHYRLGPNRLRYVDLGLSAGFEADLQVDDRGLVLRYQHLFERVAPT